MKKVFITFTIIIASLSGFSQSVTILPTSMLGGSGSSQWTTLGNNIHYGDGITNNVGIGTSNPFYPLVVRQNNGLSDQPVFQIERANNRTPHQAFVKFGGTTSTPAAITAGEMGLINFGGSTTTGFGSWGFGASIRAVAKGTFSQTSTPGQLEFATTPSSSNSVLLTRMILDENGRVGINTTSPAGVLDLQYSAGATYGVFNPMLNILGQGGSPVFVRYANNSSSSVSIVQEATPGISLAGTNIRWRWFDNSNPSVGTTMFQWANNSFDITGALNTTGNATIGGTHSTLGVSSLRGKVTVGSTTTTGNGLEIQSSASSITSPDIYIRSIGNNVIRYGSTTGTLGMVQTVSNSAVPSSALMSWAYLDNATPTVQTTMMSLQGDGDLTVNGFTKLGEETTTTTSGVTRSSPAMKTILLTGAITATASPETTNSLTTTIPHGITNWDKIISVQVILRGRVSGAFLDVPARYNDNRPTPGGTNGLDYSWILSSTSIQIIRNATNSSNLSMPASQGVTAYAAPYRILITYVQ